MASSFRECLEKLEGLHRLARVKTEVDLHLELAGVAKKLEGGPVALFEKIKDQKYPLAIGMNWNRENIAGVFDCSVPQLSGLFSQAVNQFRTAPVAPVTVDLAPAQEVVESKVDLSDFPIPTMALLDGGPYLSNSIILAKDPDTGVRNTSVHRMMVIDKDHLGLLMDMGRHLRDYYERAEAQGKSLEITINNGFHPAYYAAATTPSSAAPIDTDELAVASALLREPARLSKSLTVGVEGLADAEMILEAEIIPRERVKEGPFGEVSGYYATQDLRWLIKVKKITHRRDMIFSNLLPGKEVWNSQGPSVEGNILATVSKQVAGVKNCFLTHGGSHYHVVLQMDPTRPGMAKNAIMAVFACFSDLQMVTVVNSDVDIFDAEDVERALCTRCDPAKDILIINGACGHELNPVTDKGLGAKMGFDCTVPVPRPSAYTRIAFQDVDLQKYVIKGL